MTKKIDWFIERARAVHGDKYDYTLVDYRGCSSKIKIICPVHGVFDRVATRFLQGKGCPECGMLRLLLYRQRHRDECASPIKTCSQCQMDFYRTAEFFQRRKGNIDGLDGICKGCRTKRRREFYRRWAEKNRDKINEHARNYNKRSDARKKASKKWYQANKDKYNKIRNAWVAKNRETVNEYMRNYARNWMRKKRKRDCEERESLSLL